MYDYLPTLLEEVVPFLLPSAYIRYRDKTLYPNISLSLSLFHHLSLPPFSPTQHNTPQHNTVSALLPSFLSFFSFSSPYLISLLSRISLPPPHPIFLSSFFILTTTKKQKILTLPSPSLSLSLLSPNSSPHVLYNELFLTEKVLHSHVHMYMHMHMHSHDCQFSQKQ